MKKILSLVLFLNLYCVQGIAQNATLVECESPYTFDFSRKIYSISQDRNYTFVYLNENSYLSPYSNGSTSKVICYNKYGSKTGEVVLDSTIVKDAVNIHTASYGNKFYLLWLNPYSSSDTSFILNYLILDTLCQVDTKIDNKILNYPKFSQKGIGIKNIEFDFCQKINYLFW